MVSASGITDVYKRQEKMSGYAFSELGKRLLVTFSLVFLLAGATGEPVYGHSFDFTTDSFSTEVKVEKDNSLWITETIDCLLYTSRCV